KFCSCRYCNCSQTITYRASETYRDSTSELCSYCDSWHRGRTRNTSSPPPVNNRPQPTRVGPVGYPSGLTMTSPAPAPSQTTSGGDGKVLGVLLLIAALCIAVYWIVR